MKHILYGVCFIIGFASCKKEVNLELGNYTSQVEDCLKDSLLQVDYCTLDFAHGRILRSESIGLYFFRVPFKGKNMGTEFLIVKTDKSGKVKNGKIIHLQGKEMDTNEGIVGEKQFNGTIEISSLNRDVSLQSKITGGYIEALHPKANTRNQVMMAPELPDIIVVSYVSSEVSYSDWMLLQSVFYNSGGFIGGEGWGGTSGGGGYYFPLIGGGASGSNGTPIQDGNQDPIISVDMEKGVDAPTIEIQKYMGCFGSIPDEGSTCTIEILTDIPVDGNPSKFFNWQSGSPGHTFLKLKKQNGSQSVQQVFGWYPSVSWSIIPTPAPVQGKFVDNAYHEFNASYTVNITPLQLHSAINEVLYLSRFIKYDIDEYNCTDFALDVFNNSMSPQNQLTIQKYDIPGGESPTGTNTPNGLYLKLKQMREAGDPGASNIEVPGVKGWVGPSNGPCE